MLSVLSVGKQAKRMAIVICCCLLSSCEKLYELDAEEYIGENLVFNGMLTNEEPPYFFHLTRPAAISAEDKEYEGISDAIIVITDVTENIKDTLRHIEPKQDATFGFFSYTYYDYHEQKNDTQYLYTHNKNALGIYMTTRLYGTEGHSYLLEIFHNGKYYASDIQKMEPALVITDIKLKSIDLGEKGKTWAPCISFINPKDVDNYYLFSAGTRNSAKNIKRLFTTADYWEYSILSDENLEEEVVDFIIDDGESPLGYPDGRHYPFISGGKAWVFANTLSKSCYEYFEQAIKQFRTDGGAYTPRPASIKGNISGGVYGCFRVSAISEKSIKINEDI